MPPPKGSGTIVAMKKLEGMAKLTPEQREQRKQAAKQEALEANLLDVEEGPTQDDIEASEAAKAEGTALFKAGKAEEALRKYRLACQLDPGNTPATLNVSMCCLKLGWWEEARVAADFVLEASIGANAKAWFRRGTAAHDMQAWSDAVFDLTQAQALEPSDQAIKAKLTEAKAALQDSKEDFYFSYSGVVEPEYEAIKAAQPTHLQVVEMALDESKRLDNPDQDGLVIEEVDEQAPGAPEVVSTHGKAASATAEGDERPTWIDGEDEDLTSFHEAQLPGRALWVWQTLLKEVKGLVVLNLKANIGPEGCKFLAEGLKTTQCLETLRLVGCGLRWQGAEAVANALAQNGSILSLDLSYNSLGAQGVRTLIKNGLQENARLTRLSLAGNHIGQKGVEALADLLQAQDERRGAVVELNLAHNKLGFKAVRALGRALREDKTLERLDLSLNDLRGDAVYRLATAAIVHLELRVLDLRGREIAQSTQQRIAEKARYKRCEIKVGSLPDMDGDRHLYDKQGTLQKPAVWY